MILVTGGDGQLGSCLKEVGIPNATFLNKSELNITDVDEVNIAFKSLKPKIVINCAAYTNVDKSENQEELAHSINALGAKNLAKAAAKIDALLIQISTDYVFSGCSSAPLSENDICQPKTAYGRTKLAGEIEVLNYCPKTIIIRTSWLYSEFGSNFVKKILKLLENKKEIGVVSDQVGSPTYAIDLAEVIKSLTEKEITDSMYGIYHFANNGVASWFDLAREIQTLSNFNCVVNPITTMEYPTPAVRPKYSVLNTQKIRNILNREIPFWKESLKLCLQKLS